MTLRLMIRFLVLVLLVLTTALVQAGERFSGEWNSVTVCPEGEGTGIRLIQNGKNVIGIWDNSSFIEGSVNGVNTYRGYNGKLKGIVRGSKLYIHTCETSVEDPDLEGACPRYSPAGYLVRDGSDLIWVRGKENRMRLLPGNSDPSGWRCPFDAAKTLK